MASSPERLLLLFCPELLPNFFPASGSRDFPLPESAQIQIPSILVWLTLPGEAVNGITVKVGMKGLRICSITASGPAEWRVIWPAVIPIESEQPFGVVLWVVSPWIYF
jgi:hypothetical protein